MATPTIDRIVFVRPDTNIWTMKPDGSDLRQLTIDGGNDSPRWAPDGKKVAFVHVTGSDPLTARYSVEQISPDGSGRTTLLDHVSSINAPGSGNQFAILNNVRWSSDGCTVYVLASPGPVGIHPIHTIPMCGGTSSDANFAHFFDVRADGTFVTSSYAPSRYSIFIGPLEADFLKSGGGARSLDQDGEGPVAWSPDGHRIAYRPLNGSAILILDETGATVDSLVVDQPQSTESFYRHFVEWSPSSDEILSDRGGDIVAWRLGRNGDVRVIGPGYEPDWIQLK